ncbi:MAG: RNA-binding protein [Lysobacterales bacterium]
MLTLSVRGLPRKTTEQSLTEMFAAHGKVRAIKLSRDLFSGECRGFAELDMEGHEARKAIAALNGAIIEGESLKVGLKSELRNRRR